MQSDIKIALTKDSRIGFAGTLYIGFQISYQFHADHFAGPAVILNTMCEANQSIFDEKCPSDFQAASSVFEVGVKYEAVLAQLKPQSAERSNRHYSRR